MNSRGSFGRLRPGTWALALSMVIAWMVQAVLITPGSLHAATLYVPSDWDTIQNGIDQANDGETVMVSDGLYAGYGNVDLDFSGKSITLRSENGAAHTVIDCQSVSGTRGF